MNDFLYIMGTSGSGKTTLAKRLASARPEKYNRVIQYTTRQKREGEIEGDDYFFISDEKYDKLLSKNMFFENVQQQFPPSRYGALRTDLKDDIFNIVVASIEGLFSGIKNSFAERIIVLNIICEGKSFVEREGRNTVFEERFNKAALYPFFNKENNELEINDDNLCKYYEVKIEDLQRFSDEELLKFMDKICQ